MHKVKAIGILLAVIMAGLMLVTPSYATMGTACSDTGFDDPLLCGTPNQNEEAVIQQKVANVLNQVYLWIGIIAVVVIVISGIKYMTSQGNAESVKKAKSGIMYASIGLVVVLAAFAITLVITNAIQGNQVNGGGSGGGSGGGGGGGGGGSPTETVEVEYIMVSPVSVRVEIGETAKLAVNFVPDYATNRTVTFTSSDDSVATVNASGVVTGKKEGTVTVTAKSNNGKTANAGVTVFKIVEADSVSITPASVEIEVGKTQKLTATVKPDDAKDKSVTWSSSDSSIASVGSDGKVTAKKSGTATITAKTKNNKTATATVKVKEKEPAGPTAGDRLKWGSALAGMHAANNGNIDKVKQTVAKKYWGMECDIQYRSGTLYCYHDSSYYSSSSATFAETINVCKNGGTKVIIDLKDTSDASLTAIANYLKSNNLQKWVVVQTNNTSAMQSLNSKVGSKLEYWGLVMSSQSTINTLVSSASTYKNLGMTTVNIPKYSSGSDYILGTQANINKLKNAGYDVSVFTWVSFSQSEINTYNGYGVKYFMTNDLNQ